MVKTKRFGTETYAYAGESMSPKNTALKVSRLRGQGYKVRKTKGYQTIGKHHSTDIWIAPKATPGKDKSIQKLRASWKKARSFPDNIGFSKGHIKRTPAVKKEEKRLKLTHRAGSYLLDKSRIKKRR